jgi:hypothetical protein
MSGKFEPAIKKWMGRSVILGGGWFEGLALKISFFELHSRKALQNSLAAVSSLVFLSLGRPREAYKAGAWRCGVSFVSSSTS